MTMVSADFPDDDNGDVLRRMKREGDDFTKPRDVDFSVVFTSNSSAEEFAKHFALRGLKVSVQELDRERELLWDVTVTHYMLLTHAEITQIEEALEVMATPLGGRNDGWGCFRQPIQH